MNQKQREGNKNNLDGDLDLIIKHKIESMTQFRKAKDRKLLLNNPPKKETHLKGSKDNELVKDAPFSKGSFGGIAP